MSTKKIVTNTFYYGVVPKLTMLLSIVILPLTTPFLTTYDYGIYGVMTSYTSLFVSIAPLGLHVHLTNSFFETPRHYYLVWGRVLLMILLSSFLFGVLNMGILLLTLPIGATAEGLLLCMVGSVPIFLLANGLLAQHLFPLVERPKPLVFTNLAGSVLGMLVSFALIYFFKLGYWGLVSSGFVSSIFVFTVFVKFVWSDYHIVMSQYRISYDEIGLFSHGSTMGDYAVVVSSALALALAPQIQRTFRSQDFVSYRRLYFLCQAVALVTSFMICVWMPEIYSLLIRNARLAQSCDIACLLCFANVVFAFYTFMSAPAFIEKNTMQLLWLVFVPGILNFVLCYTLIPIFGYRAAIYSTIVSFWSQLAIPFVVGYYKKSVREWLGHRKWILVILVAVLADLLIANQLMHVAIWMKVLLTLVAASAMWMFYKKGKYSELV